ncbi:MAG: hypothetical protein M0019_10790 [Actinomycetota bacterium]|nr:hypothetical protein [Actinomycetota bacterium]
MADRYQKIDLKKDSYNRGSSDKKIQTTHGQNSIAILAKSEI